MPADMSITGLDNILNQIESRLGIVKTKTVVNKTLRQVANIATPLLSSELEDAYRKTGESFKGVTHGNVSWASGMPMIKIGNSGNHWRLIHLNEFGYTREGKTYSGAGNGVMQNFVEEEKLKFQEQAFKGLEELVK